MSGLATVGEELNVLCYKYKNSWCHKHDML